MATPKAIPPGRLGDSSMSLDTEPRMNPQLLKGLAIMGGGALSAAPPVTSNSPLEAVLEYIAQVDAGTQMLYDVSNDV